MTTLPIDTVVLTYGYGAEPVRAVVLSIRTDGYSVGREGDTAATSFITNEDIVQVISYPHLTQAAPALYEALKAILNASEFALVDLDRYPEPTSSDGLHSATLVARAALSQAEGK